MTVDDHPGQINVVVTDIVMPRMGGPELVEKLRRKRTGFSVIFMSGYTEAAVLENANLGKDAILLNKPFSTETLVRKMREMQEAAAKADDSPPSPPRFRVIRFSTLLLRAVRFVVKNVIAGARPQPSLFPCPPPRRDGICSPPRAIK